MATDNASQMTEVEVLYQYLGENYRSFSHKRWVVIFRTFEDGIAVLRVVDGSRDYGKLFK